MPTPTISVIIPTRNRAAYLVEALDSVFAQTFPSYEIIVIDDGSVDDTRQLLSTYIEQERIRYTFQEQAGVSAARNRGVSLAQAGYVAFLDSDDLFLPTKLEKQMKLFEQDAELGFVHCSFSKFDAQGRDLGVRDTSRFSGWIYPSMLQEWSVLMAMPCMLMRTQAIREVGGFDEGMAWAEDLDLWRRIARRYAVGVVNEPLVRVRVHASSTSFDRSKGSQGFERYLEKAFAEDPELSPSFKRRVQAKMYTKFGQNLLGQAGAQEMKQVRQHLLKALAAWPLQLGAVLGLAASLFPLGIRRGLVTWLRKLRYPAFKAKTLSAGPTMRSSTEKFPILFLGTQMEMAGAQRSMLAQARWFHHQGYPVQAVFFYDKQELQPSWQVANPFPVISLGGWNATRPLLFNIPSLLRGLNGLIRLLRTDVKALVTFTPHSNLLGLPLAWVAGVPVRVGTHHGYIEGSSRLMDWLHGRLTNSRLSSIMVAVSAQVRDYAIKNEKASENRLIVIQNGIEPLAKGSKPRATVRKEIGLSADSLMLLTVGRLAIQKGHAVLLEAIAQLAPAYPQAQFAFAGEGPLRSNLQAHATRLGIGNRVHFLGVQEDVASLLFAADIFVQPSLWEGLSLALLEALSAGLPVVATRVGGVVDVVEDEKSALLVAPGEVDPLAAALVRVIDDGGLRTRIARAGQERAEKTFGIDKMCRAYEGLMQGLLDGA